MSNTKNTRRRRHPRSLMQLLVVLAVFMTVALPAMAAPGYLVDIPIDTVETGDEDSVIPLTTVSVPAEFQGQDCTAVSSGNNSSIHPGNDLLVRSGGTEVVLPDVEAVAGPWVVNGVGTLVLGSEISVLLEMGPDEFFSAGLVVTVDCEGTPEPGRIIVEKLVTDGSDTQQAFDFAASYDADGFSLSHGQMNDSGDLGPGVYSIAESVPEGWSLTSAGCSDQSPIGAVDLEAGETVTCTFTNDENPSDDQESPEIGEIIVQKVVVGEGSQVFEFTFETTGFALADNTLAHGNSSSSGAVAVGAGYAVSEVLPSGWAQVSAVCDDGSDPSDIQVSAGETVTCTFSNQVEDVVGALVLVTVDSFCDVDGEESIGIIEVEMSVPGAATVVVTDSQGAQVASFTDGGSVEVDDDAAYVWEATPSEGFEFPAGFDATASVTIDDCVQTLPFTGVDIDAAFTLGIMLLAAGLIVVTGTSFLFGWEEQG